MTVAPVMYELSIAPTEVLRVSTSPFNAVTSLTTPEVIASTNEAIGTIDVGAPVVSSASDKFHVNTNAG